MTNHGIIPGRLDSDWSRGTIPWENRNPSGNWQPYLVVGEHQSWGFFDCMACVSFASNNTCEIQIKQQTGQEVNKSDRFLAKVSGTTQEGNRVPTVLDADDNSGFVYEPEWTTPANPNWDSYYAQIPQALLNEGVQNKIVYNLQYEYFADGADFTPANIQHELQHAPLLITVPGHEICAFRFDSQTNNFWVLDDYLFNIDPTSPFIREISLSEVTDIYKAVVTVKGSMGQFVQTSNTEFGLEYVTDFVTTIVKFTSPQDAQEKLKNVPGALNADGTVDFSKARRINL